MPPSKNIILGIDLGTTNSLVAYADATGPRVLTQGRDDSGLVPSVVAFDPHSGLPTIGIPAREHAVENPLNTVFSIKRLMGRGFNEVQEEIKQLPYRVIRRTSQPQGQDLPAVQIGKRLYTAPEISALILKELRKRAETYFGQEIRQAVITVPAYFDDAQRQATRDAGRIAGLEVLRIVNEPTAAALAYRLDRTQDCTVAIYDFGGGTFDISILRISDGVFEVLSTHGHTALGGDDIDREIMDFITKEAQNIAGLKIDSPASRQALRLMAEQAKIRLSTEERADFTIDWEDRRSFTQTIQRTQLEFMIEPWVEKTLNCCRQALHDAQLQPEAIDQVVMVGGSTRIPFVRQQVSRFFNRPLYTALNPEQVVALGAAVQASILAGTTQNMLLLDITPLSLGIETLGGAMGKLILRNTRIPIQAKEMFTTFVDGQTSIRINVLQGERELAKDCRILGTFDLKGIPPMPAGIPKVEVSFLIDQNGILNVTATELRSNRAAQIQIVPAHGLSSEEVDRMVQDSYVHARQDMTAHRLIDLKNQVTFDTHKAEQMLQKSGHLLSPQERGKITTAMSQLRYLVQNSSDADQIHLALNEFDHMTVHLAEVAINESLKTTASELMKK